MAASYRHFYRVRRLNVFPSSFQETPVETTPRSRRPTQPGAPRHRRCLRDASRRHRCARQQQLAETIFEEGPADIGFTRHTGIRTINPRDLPRDDDASLVSTGETAERGGPTSRLPVILALRQLGLYQFFPRVRRHAISSLTLKK